MDTTATSSAWASRKRPHDSSRPANGPGIFTSSSSDSDDLRLGQEDDGSESSSSESERGSLSTRKHGRHPPLKRRRMLQQQIGQSVDPQHRFHPSRSPTAPSAQDTFSSFQNPTLSPAHHAAVRARMEDMALEDDALRHQKRRKIFENDQEGRTRSKGEAATLDIRLAPAQGPEHLYASTIEEHGNEACMEGPGRKSFGWNGGTAEGGVTAQQEGNDDSGLGFTTIAGSDQASAAAQQGQTDTVDVDAIDGGNIANVQHPVEVHLSPTRDRFGNVPGFAGAAEGWTNAQSGQQVHGPEVQEWEWEAPTQHQEQRMDQGGYAAGRSKIYRQPRSYEIEKDRVVVTSLSDTESERSAASTTRSKHGPIADRIDAGEDDDDDIIELTRPSTSSSAASETILQPGDGRNGFILSPTYLSAIDRNALSANDRQGLAELVRKLRSGGSGPWQSQMQRDRQGGMIVYRRPPGYGKGPFSMTRNNTNGKMLEQDASHRFELVNEDDVSMQGTAGMEDVAMNDDEDTGFMINEASAPQPMESEDNDTMEIG